MDAAVAESRKAMLKSELARFGKFMLHELKPKGKVLTPFNIITGGIMLRLLVEVMNLAIDLDDHPGCRAIEVRDIRANRILTPESNPGR